MNEDKLDRILIGQSRLEVKVEGIEKTLKDHAERSDDRIEALENWRVGNGVTGMDKKVDRLEQGEKRKSGYIKALVTGFIALSGGFGLAVLKYFLFGGLG